MVRYHPYIAGYSVSSPIYTKQPNVFFIAQVAGGNGRGRAGGIDQISWFPSVHFSFYL